VTSERFVPRVTQECVESEAFCENDILTPHTSPSKRFPRPVRPPSPPPHASGQFFFAQVPPMSNGTTKMTPTDLDLHRMHRACPVLVVLLLCSKSCCALSLELSRTHLGGARRAARPSPSILHHELRFRSDHVLLRRRHDWRLELAPNMQQQEGHVTRSRQHHETICGNSCTQQRPVSSSQRQRASALRAASSPSSVDDDASTTTTTTGNDEGDLHQSNALADPTNDDGDNSLSISKVQAVFPRRRYKGRSR
jgi:hypothetical protein